jgi:hypothetical protein
MHQSYLFLSYWMNEGDFNIFLNKFSDMYGLLISFFIIASIPT